MRVLFGLYYRVIRWLTQPSLSGQLDLDPDSEVVYVQSQRVLSDLFILDHAIRGSDYPSPLSPLELGDWRLTRRTFALRRPVAGRMTMQTYSERMLSLPNAGGSSIASEALALEVLERAFGARLVMTESELLYRAGSKMTDFAVPPRGPHVTALPRCQARAG